MECIHLTPPTCNVTYNNIRNFLEWMRALLEKNVSVSPLSANWRTQLRTCHELLDTTLPWCSRGFRAALDWFTMIQRDASLSDGCTPDSCIMFRGHVKRRVFKGQHLYSHYVEADVTAYRRYDWLSTSRWNDDVYASSAVIGRVALSRLHS